MVGSQLPSGTVTFLFTDIEGSTRLIEELGENGYVEALAEHRRLLRDVFSTHGGVEVDTQGDAFLCAFADPVSALAAAGRGQEALASVPVTVRMGLHTGEPRLTGEGYAGRELHRAARIAASGHGGQIVVSAATRAFVDGDLTELGEHRLKDFAEPVALFQLGSERFPPLKTISNTNLPRPASSFVGRERERDEVVDRLRNGTRLLTLSGPGGSGKTRLALEAATELVPAFKAGVFWVGLAPLRDPALVTEAIAETLGAKDGLAEHVADRELLLLLDNFEQVVEAAPELGQLLERCQNLKLLVTSRELLRISGEVEYSVPPLAEPEAVALFCARSQLHADEAVAELCRRLDDLPLALELAAARTSVLSPAQILERLSQRLDLLEGGRDADPRQRTLRATIAWSHELLDDRERGLFARLAVFRGGCTLQAAEQVAGADLDTLQSLVHKSLVRRTNERFWLLETIREFGLERLAEDGVEADLRRRHAVYFLSLAEEAGRGIAEEGPAVTEWLERTAADHDNFRNALEWARDCDEAEVLLRLTAGLTDYWLIRGFTREHHTWSTLALGAGSQPPLAYLKVLQFLANRQVETGDVARAAELAEELRRVADAVGEPGYVMRAINLAGRIALERGDLVTARRHVVRARDLAVEAGDRGYEGSMAINLAFFAMVSGDFRTALESSVVAAELFRKLEDEGSLGTATMTRGWSALGLGDLADAEASFREGLAAAERLGSVSRLADGGEGLAAVFVALGREERGAQLLGAAAALRDEFGLGLGGSFSEEVHERSVTQAKAALGEEGFAAGWARGREMGVEETRAFCREE